MKIGDLVKCDQWVPNGNDGRIGIVTEIQDVVYCVAAYVLMTDGRVEIVRVENLEVINGTKD